MQVNPDAHVVGPVYPVPPHWPYCVCVGPAALDVELAGAELLLLEALEADVTLALVLDADDADDSEEDENPRPAKKSKRPGSANRPASKTAAALAAKVAASRKRGKQRVVSAAMIRSSDDEDDDDDDENNGGDDM